MIKKDILIVDDDKDLAAITRDVLEDYGYLVETASCSEEAYEIMRTTKIKLILLDINLPRDTGFDFCKEIRKNSIIPIIFISARTSETDRIIGLDIGADDYLSKPFSLQELLSRVKANLRRAYGFQREEENYKVWDLEVDALKRKLYRSGKEISLSLKEFDLLLYLIQNKNKALKKETILSEIWGVFHEVEPSTVAVHIRWLREKLEIDPGNPKMIKTIWGVGYQFSDGEK